MTIEAIATQTPTVLAIPMPRRAESEQRARRLAANPAEAGNHHISIRMIG
jgi:hypothetical protein